MWPFRRKPRPVAPNDWDMSRSLLQLSRLSMWLLMHAFNGTFISGETGGGKSSGSGFALAMAFLRSGFGGLVLCVKKGERETWERYARLTGREKDLVIFDASCRHRYSFLDAEANRTGSGAGLVEVIVQLLSTILEVAERNGGQGGREDEGYWRRAVRQMIRNLVGLLLIAQGRVTVPDLYRLVVSAPTNPEQLKSEDWKQQSFCFRCLATADKKAKSARDQRDFELIADYFMLEFPGLSDKTRSVIVSTFTSLVDVLNRNLLYELFSTDTTVRPEDTFDGRILVIDLPVKEFAEVGQFAGVLWKFVWQRAVERRDVDANPRPVFLFVDEFQHFLTSHDSLFQTTARSSRVATVYLTQNISNLLAGFGGDNARALTDSLLGNLTTKIAHLNSDPVTNEWFASVIGRSRQFFMNMNSSFQPGAASLMASYYEDVQSSSGMSEQMEFEVQPRRFTTLRSGGPQNGFQVDAILYQGGRVFEETGKAWLPVTFDQRDGRIVV